ncbi:UPF0481 protein At3g47200-like [Cornus florida]|uniref:UPF0481 protein At3g47200-like n=1 Tax=Cornus florida TaxID=4283 RepID=UPI00289C0AB2|nr:UPF0481 protein At3g47200-like [Cornus florida]
MENEKYSYMQRLFFRCQNHKQTRENCVNAMFEMESEVRKRYAGLNIVDENEEAAKVKLLEMILVDGCFIIELLYKNYKRSTSTHMIIDSILDNYSMKSAVQHDLIRLENQIPFFILDKLFSLTVKTIDQFSLRECIFLFFKAMMGLPGIPKLDLEIMPLHILSFLHSCYVPWNDDSSLGTEQIKLKYSATQLDLAGVKFKPAGFEMNLFNVNFYTDHSCFQVFRSSCFEIPPYQTFLSNLIAFEQFSPVRKRHFTSHAFLINKLINTTKEVDLLIEAGVIHNYLGSSEEVARLYNNVCKNVYVGSFYFTETCSQVTGYCNRFWPRCLAKLRRDYFGNPWTGISVLAAISIFVLTLLQTIYTLRSYN